MVKQLLTKTAVGNTAAAIRQMKAFLLEEAELTPSLAEYSAQMELFAKLKKLLLNAILEKGEIKNTASAKLGGLRTAIILAKGRVKEKLEELLHAADNQKYFQEQLVTMRGDSSVIPIEPAHPFNINTFDLHEHLARCRSNVSG